MREILVDDEMLALNYLKNALDKIGDYEVVGTYTNPVKAYNQIDDLEIDVAFLDIEMPGMNGIELAEKLLEKRPHLLVVFVTAYENYAIKAFEVNSIDY